MQKYKANNVFYIVSCQHFLGGGHQLRNTELVWGAGERYRLTSQATGTVTAQLHIVLRCAHLPTHY